MFRSKKNIGLFFLLLLIFILRLFSYKNIFLQICIYLLEKKNLYLIFRFAIKCYLRKTSFLITLKV